MNTKEAYEAQVAYFSRPHAKFAADKYGTCMYRMPNGSKCAIGCLIPDELYRPNIEGASIGRLTLTAAAAAREEYDTTAWNDIREFFADCDMDYLAETQRAHDIYASSELPISAFLDRLHELYGNRD